jgi:hypothetical protein
MNIIRFMRNIWQTSYKLVLVAIVSACSFLASCGTGETQFFKAEFYTITLGPAWHSFEYHRDLRKETGAFRYAIFQKSPVKVERWSDEDSMEYGLILSSYFDSRVKPNEFKYVESITASSNMELVKDEFLTINGLQSHWFEAYINTTSSTESVYNLVLNAPINNGYIEIRAWCPKGNTKLVEEYKRIAKTLYVEDMDYFKNNPQDDPWRIKQ